MARESYLLSLNASIRSFIFTILAILSPFYLLELGLNAIEIGLLILAFAAVTMVFVYLFSFLKIPLKERVLILSVLLFITLAILFFIGGITAYIIALLISGTSLSGKDFTANRSIEQYAISHFETNQRKKNLVFSYYNFGSYAASALAAGLIIMVGYNFKLLFFVSMIVALFQSVPYAVIRFPSMERIRGRSPVKDPDKPNVRKLGFLFAIDALGGGMITTSLIVLWFRVTFDIAISTAGIIFLIVSIVTAISVILSSKISNRIGLVRTMVFTHLVSNMFLILIPVIHYLPVAEIFLYLRQTTSQMDVPARDSFTNTIISKESRIRSNSIFISIRNGSQIPGPGISGLLISTFPPLMFFVSGTVKAVYDLLLYSSYHSFKDP
ncbi:MAG: MFS transporter [Thermoplasmatales archaeon]|nr:MFS transporter [Thermoplasmatales archaeon]MCW6170949.1 MFS transporter [Thermoplasmatales archaeon]